MCFNSEIHQTSKSFITFMTDNKGFQLEYIAQTKTLSAVYMWVDYYLLTPNPLNYPNPHSRVGRSYRFFTL